MPRTQINYDNTYFYRIVCKDLSITDFYIGHTTDFRRRKTQHKTSCNNKNGRSYKIEFYQFIRANNGWDNWDMILIEQIQCDDGLDARKKERCFVESMHASLTSSISSRTTQERECENKEHIVS